jgi:hypothetical protein
MTSAGELDLLLRQVPAAYQLYKAYVRENASTHLLALYRQDDDYIAQALCALADAQETGVRARVQFMRVADCRRSKHTRNK